MALTLFLCISQVPREYIKKYPYAPLLIFQNNRVYNSNMPIK